MTTMTSSTTRIVPPGRANRFPFGVLPEYSRNTPNGVRQLMEILPG